MKRGFFTIMWAQFFSSLADQALFVAAVQLLRSMGAPDWQQAALVPMFALFYVVLAPFVGAFADALPKGRVMLISNTIKAVGCLMMLFGTHPLMAYAIVGLGAAAYSPAKYGILTELLPPSQLVKANGWIEGLTIASIILGVLLGGQLVGPQVSSRLLAFDFPFLTTGIDTAPEAAIASMILVYLLAAGINLKIPRTDVPLRPWPKQPWALLPDFWTCNSRLWRDKLGQISLATTTLFWGVLGNLKYIVLGWAAVALGYDVTQASALVGVVAIGTAAGAVVASMRVKLDQATSVIPLGIAMGLLVLLLNLITNVWLAAPFLIFSGCAGRLFGGADERAAAAPRPQPDGCGPLDCGAELQRASLHPVAGWPLQPVEWTRHVRIWRHHRLRPDRRRLHVDHPPLVRAQSGAAQGRDRASAGDCAERQAARVKLPQQPVEGCSITQRGTCLWFQGAIGQKSRC